VQLEKFVEVPEASRFLVPVYENFIVDFEKRMNQLSLVQYMVRASKEFEGEFERSERKSRRGGLIASTVASLHECMRPTKASPCPVGHDVFRNTP